MRCMVLPVGARVFFNSDADFACVKPVLWANVRCGTITESRGRDAGYPHYLVLCDNGKTYRAALGELNLQHDQPKELKEAFAAALADCATEVP